MPVRFLSSSVLKWPDKAEVEEAVRSWAVEVGEEDAGVVAVGYFGSYARGDWGVGSDVDLVVVKAEVEAPFERRALAYDATSLPVPADVFVYSTDEWERMLARGGLARAVAREIVWVLDRSKERRGRGER